MSTFFFCLSFALSSINVRFYIGFGVEFIKWHKMNLCAIIIESATLIAFNRIYGNERWMIFARHTVHRREKREKRARMAFKTSPNKSRNIIQKDTQYWLRSFSICFGHQVHTLYQQIIFKYIKQQSPTAISTQILAHTDCVFLHTLQYRRSATKHAKFILSSESRELNANTLCLPVQNFIIYLNSVNSIDNSAKRKNGDWEKK